MGTIVTTRQGRLEGETRGGVECFRGIPYARPPMGPLRFQAPQAPESWEGVRPATEYGAASPQIGPVNRVIRTIIGAAGSRQSQDCLYLNVWTPACDGARRPVMVWIHGGAFILGSGSTRMYAGDRLAHRGDVVVVTINYRLGALGFLSWDAISATHEHPPANVGLRDQIAALEWVRDNIEGFGGDPENVTVFGESAGAMSIGTLLGVPAARGLFHRAILQSGAAHNVSSVARARNIAETFAEALRVDDLKPETLLELPVMRLMEAQARTTVQIGLDDGIMAWQPCVDGDLIPEQPLLAVDRGDAADVPVMIGTNREEFRLFTFANRERLDNEELVRRVRRMARHAGEADDERLADRLLGNYGPRTGERDPGAAQRWVALQSDRVFHYPAVRLADVQSAHQADTYAYLFEWRPPLLGGALGACHGLEIPFVFGGVRSVLGSIGLVADRRAGALCDAIQDAWTSFARSGRPDRGKLQDWTAYGQRGRYTMSLGGRGMLKDPHEGAREFWQPLIPDGDARVW